MTNRQQRIRFTLGIVVLIVTLYGYRNMFVDVDYLLIVINKFTLIGNLIIGIGLTLLSLNRLKPKYYLHIVLTSLLIFIVMLTFLKEGILDQGLAGLILHYLIPVILIVDYLFIFKEHKQTYKDVNTILFIPLNYLLFTYLYWIYTSEYPYEFLNFGNDLVILIVNIFVLLVLYLCIGIMLVAIKMFIHSKQ